MATICRDLETLRDRFSAPIIYDRQLRGYRFTEALPGGPRYELPGLWFNSAETHALLAFYHLLENLQPGLLAPHIQPLQSHIQALMQKGDHTFEAIAQRIRILPLATRPVKTSCFESLAHALLTRHRLTITHYKRAQDIESQREVSPQRLAYHRDNWYLDAWCHKKNKLRTFAVDTLRKVEISDKKARDIADKTLDAELGAGYGIFAGQQDPNSDTPLHTKTCPLGGRRTMAPRPKRHIRGRALYPRNPLLR
ncbi:MAG: WYL domain-containing protein [Gammaproteobacteria bacterium]|nr:WYL domain-containing protein [Gammaproteobacteria bacterium]